MTHPHPPAGPVTNPPPSGPKFGERLYTVKELAELWGCSDDHIYDLIAAAKLGWVNVGLKRPMVRIPESDAAAFRAARAAPAVRRGLRSVA